MSWLAGIFLTISLLGGAARLLIVFLSPAASVQVMGMSMNRQKMLMIGIVNVVFSILGFVLMVQEIFSPTKILFGLLLLTTLPEIAFNIRKQRASL